MSMDKNVEQIIEEVCEEVCDNLCKYRDTATGDDYMCDYMRLNGDCPLDRLH